MPNYSHLLTSNLDRKPPMAAEERTELCYGCNTIPPLWLMLFEESSIITATQEMVDEETGEEVEPEAYPYLVTSAQAALARARERLPAVISAIGVQRQPFVERWLDYLATHARTYLHLDPYEIAMMYGENEEFRRENLSQVAAFREEPWTEGGFLWKRRRLTPTWERLLSGGGISDRPTPEYTFVGYASIEPAPWDGGKEI